MDSDGLIAGIALAKVIALQHPRNGVLRGKTNEVSRGQLVHPGGIEGYFGLGRVEDLEDLGLVRLRILQNLLARQGRTGNTFPTGVTNHPSEVADEEDHLMPQVLELAQLINKHGMAKMQIGSGRVEAGLDPQGLATLQLGHQFRLYQDLVCTALDQRQLLFNRLHLQVLPNCQNRKGTNHTRSQTKNKFCRPSGGRSQARRDFWLDSRRFWLYFRQLFIHNPKTPITP